MLDRFSAANVTYQLQEFRTMGKSRYSSDERGEKVDWESQNGEVTHTKYTSGELKGEHIGYDRITGRSFYAGHDYVREREQEQSSESSDKSSSDKSSSDQ